MRIPQAIDHKLQITNYSQRASLFLSGFTPLETNDQSVRSKRFLMGFTLVEMLLVVVIFSLMFAVAFDVMLSGRRSFDVASIRYDLQTNAALGLNNMARELKDSASLYLENSNDSIRFKVPIAQDSQSGDIIWGADPDEPEGYQISYMVNGTKLERNILDLSGNPVGAPRILANYVDNVSFISQANGLSMNITASEQNKVTKEWLSESLSLTITFLNNG